MRSSLELENARSCAARELGERGLPAGARANALSTLLLDKNMPLLEGGSVPFCSLTMPRHFT